MTTPDKAARYDAAARPPASNRPGTRKDRDAPGFFIPYRYVDTCNPRTAPAWLETLLANAEPTMREWLAHARTFSDRLSMFAIEQPQMPDQPRYNQDWFTGLDATMAYVAARSLQPATILEIGSGHSTRFFAQAIFDGQLGTHLHSIDPEPRKAIDNLCAEVTRAPLQALATERFSALQADDILFLDGSHIAMPGTDVEQVFVEILPNLQSGVVVHIHDVFLPDPYPADWSWRGYNEQSVVAAILGTGRLQVLCANAYITNHKPEWLTNVYCPLESGYATSLWVRVT